MKVFHWKGHWHWSRTYQELKILVNVPNRKHLSCLTIQASIPHPGATGLWYWCVVPVKENLINHQRSPRFIKISDYSEVS